MVQIHPPQPSFFHLLSESGLSRVSSKPYFVYVLWSRAAGRFYVGVSAEPGQRLQQHNESGSRGWTARHRPWILVHTEPYENYRLARKREIELKAQKSGQGFFQGTASPLSPFGPGLGPFS